MTAFDTFDGQRQASEPQRSVWVKASAGSGKTKVLTDRVLRLLLDGAHPGRILCLTFTKAAAAEMASRIAGRLAEWAVADEDILRQQLAGLVDATPEQPDIDRARRLFATVLDAPGGLTVQTIHGFCQSVLQRFPVEAELPPGFTVLDERTATERMRMARDIMIMDARDDRIPDIRAALADLSTRVDGDGLSRLVGDLLAERGKMQQAIAGAGTIAALERRIRERHGLKPHETAETLLAEARKVDETALAQAAAALENGRKTDVRRAETIRQWLGEAVPDEAGYEAYRSGFLTKEGEVRNRLATKDVIAAAPEVLKTLESEAERLLRLEERRNGLDAALRTIALLRVASHVLDTYEDGKRRHGLVDFDDLILAVRDLLERPGVAPWALYKLDGGIDHILIDEAQDTNPEQWQIIEALTEEFFAGAGAAGARIGKPRTVFAVGDLKQSIFSFQRADPEGFVDAAARFAERAEAAGGTWSDVALDRSFRSTRAVLEGVDAVFRNAPARDGVHDGDLAHVCHRDGQAGRLEIWSPEEPDEDAAEAGWQPPVEQRQQTHPSLRLAQRIAGQIRDWLDSGETLDSRGRPIRPGDILILVRRRGVFVGELVRTLKNSGIDVAGVDRMVLTDQLAVMDLVALGQFLILPEDDLTLATVLKGPLIGLSEEALFELCHNRRNRRVWHELAARAPENAGLRAAFNYLSEWLNRADFTPPYEMFAEILAAGGRRKLVERLGPEASDPLDEFLVQALAYEQAHVPSLQGFLHWLAAAEFEVKRDLETGRPDQVRIMTVHGSKGLQAPIVFLADAMQAPAATERLLWTDSEGGAPLPLWLGNRQQDDSVSAEARSRATGKRDQEYHRLLYVGMTRAEDRLYVTGWRLGKNTQAVSWHDMVWQGLQEVADDGGDQLVLCYPQSAPPIDQPDAAGPAGPVPGLPDWATRPVAPEPRPPRPLRPSRPEDDPPVRSPFRDGDSRRFLRGRIIHYLLQWLPQMPPGERGPAARRYLASPVHALPQDEQERYGEEVMALIGDSRFRHLFAPDALVEVPVVGMVGEGANAVAVSGRIDRLLVQDDAVVAIDFKTNRPPPVRVARVSPVYLRQMALYRDLLRSLYPGRSVQCALLWTDGPSLMALPDPALDGHSLLARS